MVKKIDDEMARRALEPVAVQMTFDYSEYSPELAASLERHAAKMEGFTKRYAADMGKELAEAKAEIHAEKQTGWTKWVEGRLGITVRWADKVIEKYENSKIENLVPNFLPNASPLIEVVEPPSMPEISEEDEIEEYSHELTEEDHYIAAVDMGFIEYSRDGHALVKERDKRNVDNIPVAVPHISSKNNEWYTPWEYIAAARLLMGSIDIDPASNEFANQAVQASLFYDISTNGLDKVWTGRVWLNPPYGYTDGRSNQDIWSQRLIDQYADGNGSVEEAVLLVNAAVDTKWFHRLLAYPVCLTLGRINFSTPEPNVSGSTHGSAFVYFGPQPDKFFEIFSEFGTVVKRW